MEGNIMESRMAKHISLQNCPVAVLWAEEMPTGAIHFQEGKWGCVIALIKAASQGKVACASNETTVCQGEKQVLAFRATLMAG